MSKLGPRMVATVQEAIAIAEGRADPVTYRIHVPAQIDTRRSARR